MSTTPRHRAWEGHPPAWPTIEPHGKHAAMSPPVRPRKKWALRDDQPTGQIALERLVDISIALSKTGEIENLFSPTPIHSVDELSQNPQRQREGNLCEAS